MAVLIFYSCLFQGDSDKLIEEIQQLSKSLLDSETVALDAKKESAFLRTENLELKERMVITFYTLLLQWYKILFGQCLLPD